MGSTNFVLLRKFEKTRFFINFENLVKGDCLCMEVYQFFKEHKNRNIVCWRLRVGVLLWITSTFRINNVTPKKVLLKITIFQVFSKFGEQVEKLWTVVTKSFSESGVLVRKIKHLYWNRYCPQGCSTA